MLTFEFQQIFQIQTSGSSGVLSLSTAVLATIGESEPPLSQPVKLSCPGIGIRCFTSTVLYLETQSSYQDPLGLFIGFLFLLCQCVIVGQIFYYERNKEQNKKEN